ncbi:MAG: putative heme iron utilization protein [Planctomycetota bacterium]
MQTRRDDAPMTDSALATVRALFSSEHNATLCTAHAEMDGWPFGSIVPYLLTPQGDALVFLSDISEHSKNLQADERATLFVADPAVRDLPQSGARHAMMVKAHRPQGEAASQAEAQYFARFPDAERMRSAHGFELWLLECQRIRWIAGYGGMGWLERDEWTSAN